MSPLVKYLITTFGYRFAKQYAEQYLDGFFAPRSSQENTQKKAHNRTPSPETPPMESLKRDPHSGEYVPVSIAIKRIIGTEEYYFASVSSYVAYRRSLDHAGEGEGQAAPSR